MKKMICKKSAALLLAGSLLFGTAVPAYAQETIDSGFDYAAGNNDIIYFGGTEALTGNAARYALIYKIGIGLSIEGHTAYVYSECKTYEDCDISVTAELQRLDKSWKTIKTYNASESSSRLCSIDKSYLVTSGHDYRVKVTVSVTDGSKTETDTQYGNVQTCYSVSETEAI